MLMIPLTGCVKRINSTCPEFPIPSEHVRQVMSELGKKDAEVKAWGNDLLRLCQKLGTCE